MIFSFAHRRLKKQRKDKSGGIAEVVDFRVDSEEKSGTESESESDPDPESEYNTREEGGSYSEGR